MPPALLQELTRLAITHDPALVRETIGNLFSEAASGSCPIEDCETAPRFFSCLIEDVNSAGKPTAPRAPADASALMAQWFAATDPLQIAEDPECGYGRPAGFVSILFRNMDAANRASAELIGQGFEVRIFEDMVDPYSSCVCLLAFTLSELDQGSFIDWVTTLVKSLGGEVLDADDVPDDVEAWIRGRTGKIS